MSDDSRELGMLLALAIVRDWMKLYPDGEALEEGHYNGAAASINADLMEAQRLSYSGKTNYEIAQILKGKRTITDPKGGDVIEQ